MEIMRTTAAAAKLLLAAAEPAMVVGIMVVPPPPSVGDPTGPMVMSPVGSPAAGRMTAIVVVVK